jgi:hypothetical protein
MVNKEHDIDETLAAYKLNAEIICKWKKHIAELMAMRERMKEAIKERDKELQQQ